MARIALIHTLIEETGGTEKLALEMYKALRELNHDVDFYTVHKDPKAWEILTSGDQNIQTIKELEEPFINRILKTKNDKFIRYRRLLALNHLVKLIKKLRNNYDIIIETQSNIPYKYTDASYIHFPALIDYISFQAKTGISRKLYNWLIKKKAKSLISKSGFVMTNSTWTSNYIKKAYGNDLKIKIVYPPVNIEELLSINGERRKIILTVSRFSPEKKLDTIPYIARNIPEAEFYLIGSTSNYSRPVIKSINKKAIGLNNFHVETDVPRKRIIELMSQASIYLHPPFAEHFGISIAEAAAAGLVPVVYKDGGGWTDIVSRIDEGLGYKNIEEAVIIIKKLLSENGRLNNLSEKAKDIAKDFSYEKFKERLNEVIEELINNLKGITG
jgi:glycosyltransferase involved in cell wall biosynthesis